MQSTRSLFEDDLKALEARWKSIKQVKVGSECSMKTIKSLNANKRALLLSTVSEEQIKALKGVEIITFSGKYIHAQNKLGHNLVECLSLLPNLRFLVCSFHAHDTQGVIDNFVKTLPKHVPICRLTKDGFTLLPVPAVTSTKRKRDDDLVVMEEKSSAPMAGNELERGREKEKFEHMIEKLQEKKRRKKETIELLNKNLEEQKYQTDQANQALAAANQELAELKEKMAKDIQEEVYPPALTPSFFLVEERSEGNVATPTVFTPATPELYSESVFTDANKKSLTFFRSVKTTDDSEIIDARKERDEAREQTKQLKSKLPSPQATLSSNDKVVGSAEIPKEKLPVNQQSQRKLDELPLWAKDEINYLNAELIKQKIEQEKNFILTMKQIEHDCTENPERVKLAFKYLFGSNSFADESLEIRQGEQLAQAGDVIEIDDTDVPSNAQPKF